jgi:predicted patatin/cPLA2 family phospholipase
MVLPFKKLVLSGGGMKGILHIGALNELSKHQELDFSDGVWGCSIGAIVGIIVAFKKSLKTELICKYMKWDTLIPEPNMNHITNSFSSKGLFTMDKFLETMNEFFKTEFDINLTTTKIGDAKMPLYIIASNITKGIPTIFTKDVLLIDALRCSCCLPFIYKPQELYGQLYVDGGIFVPYLNMIVSDGLHLILTKKTIKELNSENLYSISPIDYMRQLYCLSVEQFKKINKPEYLVKLDYPKLSSDSNLDDFDIEDILNQSGKLMNDFLFSKSRS